MSKGESFFVGTVLGTWFGLMLTVLVIFPALKVDPDEYSRVLRPVAEARGDFNTGTIDTKEAEKLLNPCVVEGPLPAECLNYVVNGVVTMPPIIIMVDPTRPGPPSR